MHAAAHANADTAQVPVVQVIEQSRSRTQLGLMVAAGVVAIGAAALTLGVLTGPGNTNEAQIAGEVAGIVPASDSAAPADTRISTGSVDEVSVETSAEGENLLAARIHQEVSASLPRIQAATSEGTREGSGFFVTDDGHIATSAGLIDGANYVIAWTDDGQRWKADVIATDLVSDVAVLQIASESWPSVSLSSDDMLRTGQYALALDHEAHEIAIGEVTTIYGPVVGVDQPAALPGSALIDDTGTVIGMLTDDGTNRHATPAWMLEQVAVDLISNGTTTHTWLGVIVESVEGSDPAVKVHEVIAGSPADDAGLMTGDLIDSINGLSVADAADLYRQVHESGTADDVVLTVTRNDSRRIIIATLEALPS